MLGMWNGVICGWYNFTNRHLLQRSINQYSDTTMAKLKSYSVKLFLLIILLVSSVRCHKDQNKPEYDPCAFHMSTAIIYCIMDYPAAGAIIKSTSLTLKWTATTANPNYDISFGTDKENLKITLNRFPA